MLSQRSISTRGNLTFTTAILPRNGGGGLHIPRGREGARRKEGEGGGGSSQTVVNGEPLNKPLMCSLSIVIDFEHLTDAKTSLRMPRFLHLRRPRNFLKTPKIKIFYGSIFPADFGCI